MGGGESLEPPTEKPYGCGSVRPPAGCARVEQLIPTLERSNSLSSRHIRPGANALRSLAAGTGGAGHRFCKAVLLFIIAVAQRSDSGSRYITVAMLGYGPAGEQ